MRPLPEPDSGEHELLYVIFNGENGVISIVEAYEVPMAVHDLARSYSQVLDQLAIGAQAGFAKRH